jgi:hypothetical protein
MAQTTWNDPELRRSILEGLSALSEDRSSERRSPFVAGISMAIAVVIAITLL